MRGKRITDSKLWSWFLDIADQFEYVGNHDHKLWFKLTDQFGNIRYTVSISVIGEGNDSKIFTTIHCGDNVVLSNIISINPFKCITDAFYFSRYLAYKAKITND